MTMQDREKFEENCTAAANYMHLYETVGLCRVLGRHKMYVDTRDQSLFPHLAMDGFWESWVTLALGKLLKPGMRCIDVGANFGYYTLFMGDAVGPTGEVIAVEANRNIIPLLAKTVDINGMGGHVRVEHKAAWSESGKKMILEIPEDYNGCLMGSASVRQAGAEIGLPGTECDSVALDDLVTGSVDIVKIDAEGAEPKVLEGMKRMVAENPDIKIVMEWSPGTPGFDAKFHNELWNQFDVDQIMADGSLMQSSQPPVGLEMLLLQRPENQDDRTRTKHQNLTMEE